MLRRKAYDFLLNWKNREHKCLVVKGQRQVGKTFIIKKFGEENYESILYLNLAEETDIHKVFDGDFDIDRIVGTLGYLKKIDVVPGKTLIVFDEIQECRRARSSLKSFSTDGRYDVIASGSLLGIVNIRKKEENKPSLLPMGYEEHLTMYSLDFEEFLWACGYSDDGIGKIKECIRDRREIPSAICSKMEEEFRNFAIVGGMPESVNAYIDGKSYLRSEGRIENILLTIKQDINKYNDPLNALRTSECFDSVCSQLGMSNKKFMYSKIEGKLTNKSQVYAGNLLWIKNAGYGNFCYGLRQISKPLSMQRTMDSFKVYVSDTGILMTMLGDDAKVALLNDDPTYNLGAVAENVVAECMVKCGYEPTYYRKTNGENKMEIDFVLEIGLDLVAIEVKSGKKKESPSLDKVNDVFRVDRRIKFERTNIHTDDDGMEHYPLFAASFIDCMKRPYELKKV